MRISRYADHFHDEDTKTLLRTAATLLENAAARDPDHPKTQQAILDATHTAGLQINAVVAKLLAAGNYDSDTSALISGLRKAYQEDVEEVFRHPALRPSPAMPDGLLSEAAVFVAPAAAHTPTGGAAAGSSFADAGAHGAVAATLGGVRAPNPDELLARGKENLVHVVRELVARVHIEGQYVPLHMEAGVGATHGRSGSPKAQLAPDAARLVWQPDQLRDAVDDMARFTDVAINAMMIGEWGDRPEWSATVLPPVIAALRDFARICVREEFKQRFGITDETLDAPEPGVQERGASAASPVPTVGLADRARWDESLGEAIASRRAQADEERASRFRFIIGDGFRQDMKAFFSQWGVASYFGQFDRDWAANVLKAYSETPDGESLSGAYFATFLANVIAIEMYARPDVPAIELLDFVHALRAKLTGHFEVAPSPSAQSHSEFSTAQARALERLRADTAVMTDILVGLVPVYGARMATTAFTTNPFAVGACQTTKDIGQFCGAVLPNLLHQFVEASIQHRDFRAVGGDAPALLADAMAHADFLATPKLLDAMTRTMNAAVEANREPVTDIESCREAIKALARALSADEFSVLSGPQSFLTTSGLWTLQKGESLRSFYFIMGDPCIAHLLEQLTHGEHLDDAAIDQRLRAAPPAMMVASTITGIIAQGMAGALKTLVQDSMDAQAERAQQDEVNRSAAVLERDATPGIALTPGEQQAMKSAVGYAKKGLPKQFDLFCVMCGKLPYAGLLALQQQMNAMDDPVPPGNRINYLAHVEQLIAEKEELIVG